MLETRQAAWDLHSIAEGVVILRAAFAADKGAMSLWSVLRQTDFLLVISEFPVAPVSKRVLARNSFLFPVIFM